MAVHVSSKKRMGVWNDTRALSSMFSITRFAKALVSSGDRLGLCLIGLFKVSMIQDLAEETDDGLAFDDFRASFMLAIILGIGGQRVWASCRPILRYDHHLLLIVKHPGRGVGHFLSLLLKSIVM